MLRKSVVKYFVLLGTIVALGSLAPATASASTTCVAGADPSYCELIPTKLVASPVLLSGLSARLTRTDTAPAQPLAGQTVIFSAGGTVLCIRTTNANGTASCDTLAAITLATLHLGYTVTYPGVPGTYCPATAHGPLLNLLGIVLHSRLPSHLSANERAAMRARVQHIGQARLQRELRHLRAQQHAG